MERLASASEWIPGWAVLRGSVRISCKFSWIIVVHQKGIPIHVVLHKLHNEMISNPKQKYPPGN